MAFIVGITGGVASGKSTVCRYFADRGIPVIDTDLIARQVVVPGSQGLDLVRQHFGESVLSSDGQLDRRQLRRLVFDDATQRKALESILHPLIRAEVTRQIAACNSDWLLLAVPLLVEKGWQETVDRVMVVDLSESEQLRRLCQRDGIDPSQAKAMIDSQAPRQVRLAAADDVVDNSGDLTFLASQLDDLYDRYRVLAKGNNRG